MTSKLRSIRTAYRAASVKRSDVASAAKAVVISRDSSAGRYVDSRDGDRKTIDRRRK
jgi:ABC-type branched-subunit amino acid transport system substrate-binding protein